jgi:hypothetical protein
MEKTCENNESNTLSLQLKIILFEAELAIKEVSSRKNQTLNRHYPKLYKQSINQKYY